MALFFLVAVAIGGVVLGCSSIRCLSGGAQGGAAQGDPWRRARRWRRASRRAPSQKKSRRRAGSKARSRTSRSAGAQGQVGFRCRWRIAQAGAHLVEAALPSSTAGIFGAVGFGLGILLDTGLPPPRSPMGILPAASALPGLDAEILQKSGVRTSSSRRFPDAVDIIVRGNQGRSAAARQPAHHHQPTRPEPVKSEFKGRFVDTQAIGMPIGEACIKLFRARSPLAEANFFSASSSPIQQKGRRQTSRKRSATLSRVLRERKEDAIQDPGHVDGGEGLRLDHRVACHSR